MEKKLFKNSLRPNLLYETALIKTRLGLSIYLYTTKNYKSRTPSDSNFREYIY